MSATVTAEDAEDRDSVVSSGAEGQLPIPRPDEPNLYNFPNDFRPVYGRLPVVLNLLIALISMLVSAVTTWERLTWLDPLRSVHSGVKTWNMKKLIMFVGKALIMAVLSTSVIQDCFYRPTRISMTNLIQNYFLPSTLSRYQEVSLPGKEPLGVHYLQCQSKRAMMPRFQAMHCNHGFGACSLSWLPALPRLMDRLGARVALAHDAPGFGFTDRPASISKYTRGISAQIGSALLQEKLRGDDDEEENSNAVILLAHSMGCAATLRMALDLPRETSKFIVLVGPALGLIHEPIKPNSRLRSWTRPARCFVRRYLFDPSCGYVLRRVVGYVQSCAILVDVRSYHKLTLVALPLDYQTFGSLVCVRFGATVVESPTAMCYDFNGRLSYQDGSVDCSPFRWPRHVRDLLMEYPTMS